MFQYNSLQCGTQREMADVISDLYDDVHQQLTLEQNVMLRNALQEAIPVSIQ